MLAKPELSMRQLRPLLRLSHDGVSAREIGRRLGVARSTIQDNLKRAAAAGLAWPLADDISDDILEQRLFGRAGVAIGLRRRIEPSQFPHASCSRRSSFLEFRRSAEVSATDRIRPISAAARIGAVSPKRTLGPAIA